MPCRSTADENGRLHERLAAEGRKLVACQDELDKSRCGSQTPVHASSMPLSILHTRFRP